MAKLGLLGWLIILLIFSSPFAIKARDNSFNDMPLLLAQTRAEGHEKYKHVKKNSLVGITVQGAVAWPTPKGVRNGAVYFNIRNESSEFDYLINIKGDVSKRVELHKQVVEHNIVKMRQLERVLILPGGSVEFKPGGDHVMLVELKSSLREGDEFILDLNFEKAGIIKVSVTVIPLHSKIGHHNH